MTAASCNGKREMLGALNGEEQLMQWSIAKNNKDEDSWHHLVSGNLIQASLPARKENRPWDLKSVLVKGRSIKLDLQSVSLQNWRKGL